MCKLPSFRERLNQLLTESGNTIVAFAEFLGTSRQSLGYYLNGERIPDALMVKQICKRCNVSSDWLLGLSDVKQPDADLRAVCEYTGLSSQAASSLHSWLNEVPERIEPDGTHVIEGNHAPCIKALNIILGLPSGHDLLYALRDYILTSRKKVYTLQDGQNEPVEGDAFIQVERGTIKHMRRRDIDRWLLMGVQDCVQLLRKDFSEAVKESRELKNDGES